MSNLKSVVVATLRHGRLTAVLESTQLACSIYSDLDLQTTPKEVDKDCMKELMIIVIESETNSDWASQHAVWALASMSKNIQYCQQMLTSGDLGAEFILAIFQLAVPGTFNTQTMRYKCVELLMNLLAFNEDSVNCVLGKDDVLIWKASKFVELALEQIRRLDG